MFLGVRGGAGGLWLGVTVTFPDLQAVRREPAPAGCTLARVHSPCAALVARKEAPAGRVITLPGPAIT